MYMSQGLIAGALAAFLLAGSTNAAELIIVRQPGCPWCDLWDREIGHIYPISEEGRFAPLRHVNIRAPLPDFVTKPVTVTPTFILIENDREIGRITGYPGADFFWELLSEILKLSSFESKKPS